VIAAGIDMGGTKIEAQIFGANWQAAESQRISTPATYGDIVEAIARQHDWIAARTSPDIPVGICTTGLTMPEAGVSVASNVPTTGKPFRSDIKAAIGAPVAFINDCRAFALSEARFGAGRHARSVLGLILGTGIGGGFVLNGRLISDATGVGGEIGHFGIPGRLMEKYGLPSVTCGCGRVDCFETYASGPGMERLAAAITGQSLNSRHIAANRHQAQEAKVWSAWCDLIGELMICLTFCVDPEVIVLGGGLSKIAGVRDALTEALQRAQYEGFGIPDIRIADGGDASGARGAAYAAWQARNEPRD